MPNQPENLFIGYFYSNNKDQKYIDSNNNYNQNIQKIIMKETISILSKGFF